MTNVMPALYSGLAVAGILSADCILLRNSLICSQKEFNIDGSTVSAYTLFGSAVLALFLTALLVLITEYYTGHRIRPVQHVAKASETGHATNIIAGIGISMKSTALPVLSVCAAIFASYRFAGLYGLQLLQHRC